MPAAKVSKLAANGNSGFAAYIPNNAIAGLRNTVIAKAQLTTINKKITRLASDSGRNVTIDGITINNVDERITPAKINGKRLAVQYLTLSESPPIKGSITTAKAFSKTTNPIAKS